ncbi:MAG: diguanylate cyclase [Magnetococcus sp. DMHC-6]
METNRMQKILIVDDSPSNIRLLNDILRQEYQIFYATNGQEALDITLTHKPDIILLDILMPGMDGFVVCAKLKTNTETLDIPIIFVTGNNDPSAETQSFVHGAVDFITKPINPPVVRARIKTHLELKGQRDALARSNKLLQLEIQERKKLEQKLREQAEIDLLTGLPNRRLFQDRLQQEILKGKRKEGKVALLFLDLDRFKWVNDTLGHDAGDQLLVDVAQRLNQVVRKSDTVARLGGDEFVIILSDIHHESMAELVASKILELLHQPFILKNQEVVISGSVGIAIFPLDGETSDVLIKHADMAMYQAKTMGRNTFQYFSK